MSRRYPDVMVCPHCRLLVNGNARVGEIRSHARRAIAAGFRTTPCVDGQPVRVDVDGGDDPRVPVFSG